MSEQHSTVKVAVITGASSGIGAATARALAADVTDRDALVRAAKRIESDLGGADALVNNAGYSQLAITPADVADVITFAVTRPRRMTLNEVLQRPTSQPG